MAIPKFEKFLYPFLLQIRDKDKKKDEIKEALIKQFNLTKAECMQKTKSGSTFVIDSHLGWVRQWLRRAQTRRSIRANEDCGRRFRGPSHCV